MSSKQPDPFLVVDRDLLDFTEREGFKLDPDDMRTDTNGLPVPFFTVQDLSKFFFGRSPDWMRWRIRERFFVMGGDAACPHGIKNVPTGEIDAKHKPVKHNIWWFTDDGICQKCQAVDYGSPQRKSDQNHTRVYSLADVERMATALHQRDTIDAARCLTIFKIIQSCAALYGYL